MEKVASQQLVNIETIKDGVITLKDGGLRLVLEVEGVNFDLKSPEEQTGIINSFQEFLTSLDFSLQIIIRSQIVVIEPYLNKIAERQKSETNELLKSQMTDYMNFLANFIRENHIMTKYFLVVVPYQPAILNQSAISRLSSLIPLPKSTANQPTPDQEYARHRAQLENRFNIIANGLSRMGVQYRQLPTEELIPLFYSLYNPQESPL
jgi:type IV secretory pathway VirB4 component